MFACLSERICWAIGQLRHKMSGKESVLLISRRCPCVLTLQWIRLLAFENRSRRTDRQWSFPSCLSWLEAHPKDLKSNGLQHSRISRILENGGFGPPANWKQMLEAESEDCREKPVTKAVSHPCRESSIASRWFCSRCAYALSTVKQQIQIAEALLHFACVPRGQSLTFVSDGGVGCRAECVTIQYASISQTNRFKSDGLDKSQATVQQKVNRL